MTASWLSVEISQTGALRLIASFLDSYANDKHLIANWRLKADHIGQTYSMVELWLRSDSLSNRNDRLINFLDGFKASWSTHTEPPSDSVDLISHLPLLLIGPVDSAARIETLPSAQRHQFAEAEREQHFILADRWEAAAQLKLADELEGYAAPVRVAFALERDHKLKGDAAPMRTGFSGDPDARSLLFLQTASSSSLDAARQAGHFGKCEWLRCYSYDHRPVGEHGRAGRYTIALSDSLAPLKENLDLFAQILVAAPELFGGKQRMSPGMLAVVHPIADGLELLFTAHLHFELWSSLMAPRWKPKHCRIVTLSDGEAVVQHLGKALKEPGIGYQLRLKQTHYRQRSETEYQALANKELELRERRDELAVFTQDEKPVLMRFGQDQLASLVDVLRGFPPESLRRVLYAYAAPQSNGSTPHRLAEGAHYLLLERKLPEPEMDKLLAWEDYETPYHRQRFWLEPFWAQAYFQRYGDQSNKVQLFVPHGLRLWPSIHSWYRDDMDGYLKGILNKWYKLDGGAERALPERALCIFDGDASSADLVLLVLNRDTFKPINERGIISWINTNLHVLDRLDGHSKEADRAESSASAGAAHEPLKDVIMALDGDLTHRRVLEEALAQTRDEESAVFRQLESAYETIAEKTFQVGTALDAELAALRTESADLVSRAVALSSAIDDIRKTHDQMLDDVKLVEQAGVDAQNAIKQLGQARTRLAQSIVDEIGKAQAAQNKATTDVRDMVLQLKASYAQSMDKLHTLSEKMKQIGDKLAYE